MHQKVKISALVKEMRYIWRFFLPLIDWLAFLTQSDSLPITLQNDILDGIKWCYEHSTEVTCSTRGDTNWSRAKVIEQRNMC